jgi:hypothetical protein
MAQVTIGGIEYTVPELSFLALERAWPYLNDAVVQMDPMAAVSSALQVVVAGIMDQENFNPEDFGIKPEQINVHSDRDDQIFTLLTKVMKKRLLAREIADIRLAILVIQKEAGLEAEEGEGEKAPVNPSTETGAPSSQNSSQPAVREEVGTA